MVAHIGRILETRHCHQLADFEVILVVTLHLCFLGTLLGNGNVHLVALKAGNTLMGGGQHLRQLQMSVASKNSQKQRKKFVKYRITIGKANTTKCHVIDSTLIVMTALREPRLKNVWVLVKMVSHCHLVAEHNFFNHK